MRFVDEFWISFAFLLPGLGLQRTQKSFFGQVAKGGIISAEGIEVSSVLFYVHYKKHGNTKKPGFHTMSAL